MNDESTHIGINPNSESQRTATPSRFKLQDRTRAGLNRLVELARIRHRSTPAARADESVFDAILSEYSTDVIYVHIGLRDIDRAFNVDAYKFMLEKLSENFDSVLAPGFTPSFRQSGTEEYDKRRSKPAFGAFTRLFHEDADYRTDDATNSILVHGDYRFDNCDHHRSFGKNSCFEKLDTDDVLFANIGTDRLVCSQLHHVESVADVPYMDTEPFEGTIYYNDRERERITQQSNVYHRLAVWNREKIERNLIQDGVLDRFDLNGLKLRFFGSNDLKTSVAPRIEGDPCYPITL